MNSTLPASTRKKVIYTSTREQASNRSERTWSAVAGCHKKSYLVVVMYFLEYLLEKMWLFSKSSHSLNDPLSWENIFSCIFFKKKYYVNCDVKTLSRYMLTSPIFFSLSSPSWRFFAVAVSAAWRLRSPDLRQNLKKLYILETYCR